MPGLSVSSPRLVARVAPVVLVVFAGCGKKGGPDLVFEDTNNYSYAADFESTPIEIPVATDLTVDWSALTTDIRERPVDDPSSIDQLSLLNIKSPVEDVFTKIATNDLGQEDAQDIYLFVNDGQTSCSLSDFAVTGINIDLALLAENPDETWLLSLMNLPDGRTDILSTLVLLPTSTAAPSTLSFTDGVSNLTNLAVDLHSAPAIETREGIGPYTLDWSAVTVDTFGHTFDPLLADELIIGHYGTEDLAEIEGREFLQLDSVADELYRLDVFGVTGEALDGAVDADGNAFAGFTADGTWLVGIVCTTCATPVPLILSVVTVD